MNNKRPLGRIDKLDVHEYWAGEASDFTPWLAQDENIALLSEELDAELEVQQTEQPVGPFRADIFCLDVQSGKKVLIENQLERTDHTHLGQLLTYAAGLEAVTIVWIADRFTEEHRAALDWLNRVTNDSTNFFGFEIELWRIGDSTPAPRFNAVVRPNEWSKPIVKPSELTETEQLYFDYWTAFKTSLESNKSFLRIKKPQAQGWMTFAIGRVGFFLTASVSASKKTAFAKLVILGPNRDVHFQLLGQDKEAIEREIGFKAEWRNSEIGKQYQIRRSFSDFDPRVQADWPRQHDALGGTLETLHRCFSHRVRVLSADEWEPEGMEA